MVFMKTMDFRQKAADFESKSVVFMKTTDFRLKTADFESKSMVFIKTADFGQKTMDFGQKKPDFTVSEFKTSKLIISFQSRERIQRVSMFFFLFFGGGWFKSVDLIIKCVYLKLNWSIYFSKTVDLLKTEYLCRLENFGPNFMIVYPIDFFQDHMTSFYHCVSN